MMVYSAKTERKVQMFMRAFHRSEDAWPGPPFYFDPFGYWAAASATLERESFEEPG